MCFCLKHEVLHGGIIDVVSWLCKYNLWSFNRWETASLTQLWAKYFVRLKNGEWLKTFRRLKLMKMFWKLSASDAEIQVQTEQTDAEEQTSPCLFTRTQVSRWSRERAHQVRKQKKDETRNQTPALDSCCCEAAKTKMFKCSEAAIKNWIDKQPDLCSRAWNRSDGCLFESILSRGCLTF